MQVYVTYRYFCVPGRWGLMIKRKPPQPAPADCTASFPMI